MIKFRVYTKFDGQNDSYLNHKIASSEVSDGTRESRATPNEAEEERPFRVVERLHYVPEPLNKRRGRVNALVRGHGLEQSEWNVCTAAHHRLELVRREQRE